MRRSFESCIFLGVLLACGGALLADGPVAPVTRQFLVPQGIVRTPGCHDLFCNVVIDGHEQKMAYTICSPKGYDPGKPWPLVVYLLGAGDVGSDHKGVYYNGPPLHLKTDKALADWAPFMVLAPQCPAGKRWEQPGLPQLVLDFVEMTKRCYSVDESRMYLTGLSMGGRGVWNVALHAQGIFAVVNPFCAIEVASDKMPDAVKGCSVCIICGGADGGFTEGSRKMYQVLKDHQIDVTYAEIPGVGHGVWPPYYDSRLFYENLLMHKLHDKPPVGRLTAEQLVAISYVPPNCADLQLREPLRQFLPWWWVNNCGRDNNPGLRDEALGRKRVFVTTPLGKDVPCRLMFTTSVPKDKKTTLNLSVAANPQGKWELVAKANDAELVKRTIAGAAPPPPPPAAAQPARAVQPAAQWVNLTLDLSSLAGQDAHLELLNASAGAAHAEAYWGKVELVSQ